MDEAEARRRFGEAQVVRMATADADGKPHIVPIVFAVEGDRVFSLVDPKPKRSPELKRLQNLRANPKVALLVDEYRDEWEKLWWVRADGTGRVVPEGPERDRAIELVLAKYPQYGQLEGDFYDAIVIDVDRWRWWSLRDPGY